MSLDEMKVVLERDGLHIMRAMGFIPVEILNEYMASPKELGKPRTTKVLKFEERYAIVTRWELEKKGWDLRNGDALNAERLNDRALYVYSSIDVIAGKYHDAQRILNRVISAMSFHYRPMQKSLVKKNKLDMEHLMMYLSERICEMRREEIYLRVSEDARKN